MGDGTRTVGVEEELLLVDPEHRTVSERSGAVLRGHARSTAEAPRSASDELEHELFLHQLETRTDPSTSLDEIHRQLAVARRAAAEAARAEGLAIMASGFVPVPFEPQVSPNDRYRAMVDLFGETARTGSTCGTHVHVAIESPDEGVAIIDRIVPWLPLLVAIGANSPFAEGRDTKYASWRSQAWSRWPSAGPTEAFGSLEGYREASRLLKMTGAARDDGMLYYDARLSAGQPTVEIRVLDVCTDLADAVLAAGLVRALVETAAEDWAEHGSERGAEHGGERGADGKRPRWRAETLRAAHWRAARLGLSDTLVDPVQCELRPAREVLESLVRHVAPRLEAAGDLERVREGVERVLRAGGATRQRAAYERSGSLDGVIDDLVERTEAATALLD